MVTALEFKIYNIGLDIEGFKKQKKKLEDKKEKIKTELGSIESGLTEIIDKFKTTQGFNISQEQQEKINEMDKIYEDIKKIEVFKINNNNNRNQEVEYIIEQSDKIIKFPFPKVLETFPLKIPKTNKNIKLPTKVKLTRQITLNNNYNKIISEK